MSFAAGFQLGNRMVGEIEESRRQKVLDERAAKEFARKEQEWSRADKDREAVDAAFSNLNNVQMGLNTDAQKQIQSTYGMTPAQISQAGGIEGLKSKLASYDVPDAHELQNVPDATAAGVQPRFDASQVKVSAPSRSDSLRALQGVAIAKRDATSAASIGEQLRTAEDDDFIASALKGYTGAPEQIGGAAAYLNTNSKRVTMGAPDKNGFVRLSVVGTDGGAEFLKLNRQDQARLYAAAQLMERNPARAIEIMSSVNKELASAIAQENGLVGTVTTNANDVASKSGNLSVAQQNADTLEKYRSQLGAAASARATGGAAAEEFQRKVDGVLEGYQAAMASGSKKAAAIYAREYDQLRATAPKGLRTPPALSSLNNAQKTQGSGKAFEKLPEQGTVVADENGTRLVYSNNGYPILPGGADPYDFGKVSAERGVDQNMLELGREKGLVSVHEYGRHITLGDKAYDITNKSDVAAFNAAMRKIAREALAEEERIRAEKYPQLGISGANGLAAETNRSVLGNIRQNTR